MMRRVPLILLLACLGALVLTACGGSNQPTAPNARELMQFTKDEPTSQDEEFLDELREGTFTVCKVVEGPELFTFHTQAEGPGVDSAVLYEPTVTLGNGECADVYTAPSGSGIGADLVSITEELPAGYQIDRIAVWSKEEQGDGTFLITFHELPAGTLGVEGSIDAGKIGCVVIFYNSRIPEVGECTRTPGYWKTHPEAWPVESITIGSLTYTKEEAIDILWLPERGDKTKTLFRALLAAKLNQIVGTDVSCVSSEMESAEMWMAAHPVCSGVRGNSEAWRSAEPWATTLDDYNNGHLCALHCEDADEDVDEDGEVPSKDTLRASK